MYLRALCFPRMGSAHLCPAGCLCLSTHFHEAAHDFSLSASPGEAHSFVSYTLFLWLLSFPLADLKATTLVGVAHPSNLGHTYHRFPVSHWWVSSGQVRPLLPAGGVTWVTGWMLGLFFLKFMVSFVLFHPLQISLMELKKNVYCLLWMATPTVRGKSR